MRKHVMALVLVLVASAPMLCARASALESFPSPDAAADALVAAAKAPGEGRFEAMFGADGAALLSTGDAGVDARNLADFLDLAAEGRAVIDEAGDKTLVFGKAGWHFPIPLKAEGGGWVFDLEQGRQRVVDVTIGRNELAAIGACADYVAAQTEYFATLHDEQPVQQYARRLISTEGRHDGLYWPPANAADRSPLGDRVVAAAVAEGGDAAGPRAYHGYRFRILTRQGAQAPGGAYDYLVNGRLLAGYALVAWPAVWGETGIMTFLCDQRGTVYQRNLGASTETIAPKIRTFDPGPAWEIVAP